MMVSGRFHRLEVRAQEQEAELETLGIPERDHRYHLKQADAAYREGRFERALQLYTRCLESNRALIPAWVGQVQMLVELGEYDEARLWSDKALELFRHNPELLSAKAQSCARLGDIKAAFECSDVSLQAPGSSAWRWQVRGETILAGSGKREDIPARAEICFRKALCEEGADWFARIVVGRIHLHYGRASNAMVYLRQAAAEEPGKSFTWLQLGNCQRELGLRDEARKSYTRCLELTGRHDDARAALAALAARSWKQRVINIFASR